MSAPYTGINEGFCSVDDCLSRAKYGGLCGKHYKRKWRHGSAEITKIDMELKDELCSQLFCRNMIYTRTSGLCKMHYLRVWRYGRLDNIDRTNNTQYKHVSINGVFMYEHRFLAEQALGKPLPPEAEVHHMNNDKGDNHTPFNLVICPDRAYHMFLHKRARDLGYVLS